MDITAYKTVLCSLLYMQGMLLLTKVCFVAYLISKWQEPTQRCFGKLHFHWKIKVGMCLFIIVQNRQAEYMCWLGIATGYCVYNGHYYLQNCTCVYKGCYILTKLYFLACCVYKECYIVFIELHFLAYGVYKGHCYLQKLYFLAYCVYTTHCKECCYF